MSFRITTIVEVSDERVNDLLCSAFEGGSNYWISRVDMVKAASTKVEFLHEIPLAGGTLRVMNDDKEWCKFPINRKTVEAGLKLMADKWPYHFNNFIEENDDAETGDVFLQCVVLGEMVYG